MDLRGILLRRFKALSGEFGAAGFDVPVECGFYDRRTLGTLAPFTRDMERFHPKLRNMLKEHFGVRKWEYGMMIRGLPDLAGKDILDIGSGPSFLPVYLSRRIRSRVTVLDLPQPFTIESSEMTRRMEDAGVTLTIGDMRDMPFPDESFDVVTSISVIEHLSHSADHESFPARDSFFRDTKRTLLEMHRVLRPGGWIYLTTDAYIPGRVDRDLWAGKLLDGDPYGAYPIGMIGEIFLQPLREAGALFPYPANYGAERLLESQRWSSYRNRFMTVLNLFAQKAAGSAG